ncbi:MAG: TIGR00725 family protein [Nanoarchaeota archaeon]|nr:TIGR00725 family protein [Nanoarchaeota archaeon]
MKKQIGVMGSCQDLEYSKEVEALAEAVGKEIARANCTLFFGAEKDLDSLSTAACRGAKKEGGLCVGVTYGKGKDVVEDCDVVVATGLERGGGRELVLALSCDAIIAISGGSGTLTELAIGYQANIPLIVLEDTGGWADKLVGEYLDARKRVKVVGAKTPKEAVEMAVRMAGKP